ncbi:Na+/H+ antiporter NhaC family protein [Desulforamulus ruminis]|nr:Na+/H+ antiporter NhaC family protein [Desulforamulus ruminis]
MDMHTPLLAVIILSGLLGVYTGHRWRDVEPSLVSGITSCAPALYFLICIGATIGIWIEAGIIPAFVSYGLVWLKPAFFYAGACLFTAMIAALSTSGGAMGTVGVALMVIAHGIGADLYVTSGALISGAVMGQLISPINDMLPLALAQGARLNETIKLFMVRLLPPFLLVEVLYLVYGYFVGFPQASINSGLIIDAIRQHFFISPVIFLPVILLFLLIARGTPTVPVLMINLIVSSLFAYVFQGAGLAEIFRAMSHGYIPPADQEIMQIFARGGITPFGSIMQLTMMASIWAALLKKIGALDAIFVKLISLPLLQKKLGLQSHLLSVFISICTCAVIPAIIISGELLKGKYQEEGRPIEELYRNVIASGIIVSPLIPWTNIYFYNAGILGMNLIPAFPYFWFALVYFAWLIILGLRDKVLGHGKHGISEKTALEE